MNLLQNTWAYCWSMAEVVIAWACIAASGTSSLTFIDDKAPDAGSRMNSEVYINVLSSSSQKNAPNLMGRNFIMQQDKWGKKVEGFRFGSLSHSLELYSIEYTFHLLKRWVFKKWTKQTITERSCGTILLLKIGWSVIKGAMFWYSSIHYLTSIPNIFRK